MKKERKKERRRRALGESAHGPCTWFEKVEKGTGKRVSETLATSRAACERVERCESSFRAETGAVWWSSAGVGLELCS